MHNHEIIKKTVMSSLHKSVEKLASTLDEVETFSASYLLVNLFRKEKGNSKEANENALSTWRECEELCYVTNQRLVAVDWLSHPLISRMRRFAEDILGPCPKDVGFGTLTNNSTFDHKFGTHKSFKMTRDATITPNAVLHIYSERNPWNTFITVRGNRLSFVPKNATTSRPIAVEPTFNVAFQLGVGLVIRKRLLKWGIDLNDQSLNRNAAQSAWHASLATIDLSSASDTVSFELVRSVLPPDWFELLNSLRSPCTRLPNGTWHYLEKFSSMGNGFNFELESLIFYCLCRACGVKKPLVYGDDIIIPQHQAALVCKALTFCGLRVNHEKSFITGFFYESCGGHFYMGLDVTPVYQKELLTTPLEIIRFHNRLYRWAMRDPFNSYTRFRVVASALHYLRKLLGNHTGVPDTTDLDTGFLRPLSSMRTQIRNGSVHVEISVLSRASRRRRANQQGALTYKLLVPAELNADPAGHPFYRVESDPTFVVKQMWFGLV